MIEEEKLFKVLNEDATVYHHSGNFLWSPPHDDQPGEWMPAIEGDLVPCENGYHLCRIGDLFEWFGPAIFEAEYRGDRLDANNKIIVREARLTCRLNWDESIARLFACDCAERVLPLWERKYPEDNRPRKAIDTSRRFAIGQATREELAAARAAAWDARDAAKGTARAAAWAARTVARAAAWAAKDAAWDTARAAWDAARTAAMGTARDAAMGTARDAEREWQTSRLLAILYERAEG